MEESKLQKVVRQHCEMEEFFSGGLVVKSVSELKTAKEHVNFLTENFKKALLNEEARLATLKKIV